MRWQCSVRGCAVGCDDVPLCLLTCRLCFLKQADAWGDDVPGKNFHSSGYWPVNGGKSYLGAGLLPRRPSLSFGMVQSVSAGICTVLADGGASDRWRGGQGRGDTARRA